MKKLELYVCENAAPEFHAILRSEGYDDVLLHEYPCLCLAKTRRGELKELLADNAANGNDKLILCSKSCEILQCESKLLEAYQVRPLNHCFEYVLNVKMIDYITEKGGYVVSAGWLKNWRKNLAAAGFDQELARRFYREFCTELVFLDAGLEGQLRDELVLMADFLGLPQRSIPIEIDNAKVFLRNYVLHWRLQNKTTEFAEAIRELKRENAEYAALLHVMQKISASTHKRQVVDGVIEVFSMVFGARQCLYTETLHPLPPAFAAAAELLAEAGKIFVVTPNDDGFIVKVAYDGQVLGLIKADGFLFPHYMKKYVEFASGIAKVCGVVLQNAKHIEMLEQNKDALKYLSFHDGLTNLYNRAYFNQAIEEFRATVGWAVFICDIDGLKQINDNYGHNDGDQAICLMGELLRLCFRESDVIARLGGDEFAVLVPDCNEALAKKLKIRWKRLLAEHEPPSCRWSLRASIGYAIALQQQQNVEELIQQADERMYLEKELHKRAEQYNR